MAENDDMTGDLSLVDHNRLQERLRMSKKQRSLQLKAYEQNEKRIAKQQLSTDKKFHKKSKKGAPPADTSALRNSKIIFGDGVLVMDVIARKDIHECEQLTLFNIILLLSYDAHIFLKSWHQMLAKSVQFPFLICSPKMVIGDLTSSLKSSRLHLSRVF